MLAVLVAFVASAASFDPQMTWRTIRTEHFDITFHQGLEHVADEFAREVEPVYATMSAEVRWEPRARTQVVLVDRTDDANGYASVVPYNAIVIFVTAPQENSSLSFYEDWSSAILTHELTHVLHMDANHGIVRAARAVVGRVATTNDVSPLWMIEGFATFQETRHTTGGRGRTPYVDMVKRASVLEDAFPPLGDLDGLQPKPPSGNLRYLFGQDFMQFVADTTGEDVWTKWVHTYGSWVPFWLPTKRVFGRSLRGLYTDWRTHLEERYARQLEEAALAGPITETRRVSVPEASCSAPAFAPNGHQLVWSCYDLRTGSAIWTAKPDGSEAEVLVQDRGAKSFTWRSDSQAFVYASAHTVNRFNLWSDIYLYTVASGSTTALTNGARARDPDFSPDGAHLVMVTNRAERNQLEVATVDRRRVPLTSFDDHTQLSTPRFAPDGRSLALSAWTDGRRDLWLYSPDGEPLRRLTVDMVMDRDPFWSPDGRWLYFSSDRTGIPNIFAIEIATERLWQVTNVRTGAMKPAVSADGKTLGMQIYSNDGWEVHLLDLDPSAYIDWGPLPLPVGPHPPLAELVHPVEPAPIVPPKDEPPEEKRRRRLFGRPAPGDATDTACSALSAFAETTPGVPPPRAFAERCQSPSETVQNYDMTDVEKAFGDEEEIDWLIEPRRYNPFPWLLPRYALPYFQTTPFAPSAPFDVLPFAVQGSLVSSGSDPLAHFAWSGVLSYRTDVNYLGGGAALTWNRHLPVYSVGFSRGAVRSAFINTLGTDPDGEPVLVPTDIPYWEGRNSVFASVSYPYRPRTTIFGRYTLSFRDNLYDLPEGTYLPTVPIRGRVGTLAGGWRYSWAQPTAYAISSEDARVFSLIGSLAHPWLGTSVKADGLSGPAGSDVGLTVAQVTAELREYRVNPLIPNHVVAAKVGGGYTLGANQFLGNYQLGGSYGDSAFVSTPDEFRMLRGYANGSDIGDRYWLASLEYRFPILQIQHGWGTLPVFWRNISGAAFIDAGNAFTDVVAPQDAFDGSLVGVGAEVTTRWALGWGSFVTGRMGYGVGLTPATRGQHLPTDPRAFYFQLGGSF
ncbi:MAG: PD40 domain-containing protein [Alphaproteobacteria bacterium]|nr:PD40 domain-containing protein [Alphaproteobacteria bacterium]